MKTLRLCLGLVLALGLPACAGSSVYVGYGGYYGGYGGYGGYPGWGYPTPGVIPPPHRGGRWYDDADVDIDDLDFPTAASDATWTRASSTQ